MKGTRTRSTLAIGLAGLTLGFAAWFEAGRIDPAGKISADELVARIGGAGEAPLVLDVRTPQEFSHGHVPGALNIPYDQLAGRLDELGAAPDDEVVVYCKGGGRAAKARSVLADAGYTHVRDLEGHMQGWAAAGLPQE